jgi:hypothetical protein
MYTQKENYRVNRGEPNFNALLCDAVTVCDDTRRRVSIVSPRRPITFQWRLRQPKKQPQRLVEKISERSLAAGVHLSQLL